MAIPSLWPDALSNARVCTVGAANRNIRRVTRSGEVALREACILFALYHCKGRVDIRRIERLTSINAAAVFYTADGLAIKGYVTTDRDDKHVNVIITDSGRALLERCWHPLAQQVSASPAAGTAP
ncbi:winged helix DNA-binding protein [Bradyrhizobium archetypum]|uniref:Winged helix DNA-binding protein n=1 Tax=Bradyrhizobium archetypum TaxID=2721160 RepID=A0A7Y4H6S6_9BRAD|nr:winged helix DNA-binding protein [Bradyrhizobium archetypum]